MCRSLSLCYLELLVFSSRRCQQTHPLFLWTLWLFIRVFLSTSLPKWPAVRFKVSHPSSPLSPPLPLSFLYPVLQKTSDCYSLSLDLNISWSITLYFSSPSVPAARGISEISEWLQLLKPSHMTGLTQILSILSSSAGCSGFCCVGGGPVGYCSLVLDLVHAEAASL